MADYIIACASTADLPDTYYKEHNIPVIRYTYAIGTEVFEDDCKEESRAKAYADMRTGTVYSTSMINTATYADFFTKLMETGKNVIFLDMSKEMSSSYRSSHTAAESCSGNSPIRCCASWTRAASPAGSGCSSRRWCGGWKTACPFRM